MDKRKVGVLGECTLRFYFCHAIGLAYCFELYQGETSFESTEF